MRDDIAERLAQLQQNAIDHLLSHPRVGDYSEMGTGKTRKLVVAADDAGCVNRLILTPEVGRMNWQREHDRWCMGSLRSQVVLSPSDQIDPTCPVVIVGHNSLRHLNIYNQLRARKWDVGMVDESHNFRKNDSQRTMALYGSKCDGAGLVSRMDRVFLASGTPMPVAADGLWPSMRALRPELIPDIQNPGHPLSHQGFLDTYCNLKYSDYGPIVADSKNLDDLRRRIKPFFIRQRLTDVVAGMPPIFTNRVTLTPDDKSKKLVRELEERDEFKNIRAVLQSILDQGDDGQPLDDLERQRASKTPLSTLMRLTGVIKATAVIEQLLPELLDNAYEKIVVFAVHHDTLDILENAFKSVGVVRVDGKTSPVDDQIAIDRFQGSDYPRVFLGQLHKCNSVITLTRAHRVALAEFTFDPSLIYQGVKRVHRIGQTMPVLARIFGLENSIDGIAAAIVERRMRDVAAVFDT